MSKKSKKSKKAVHSISTSESGKYTIPPMKSINGKWVRKLDPKIEYTRNYGQFRFLNQNRVTTKKHIYDLAVSMRNEGQDEAIVVNEDMFVINGQHRLKAAMAMRMPIGWSKATGTDIKSVQIMNTVSKNWDFNDYLHRFTEKEYDGSIHWNHSQYDIVADFIKTYKLSNKVVLYLLSQTNTPDRGYIAFKKGTFKIKDLSAAEAVARNLAKLRNVAAVAKGLYFSMAFIKVSKVKDFSFDVCYRQIKNYPRKLDEDGKGQNEEEWIESIVKCYNYRNKKNRFEFNKKIK